MSRSLAILVVLLVAVLTAVSLVPRPKIDRFKTPQCRSQQLVPARPPVHSRLPDWHPPAIAPTRLAEMSGTVHGSPPAATAPLLDLGAEVMSGWTPFTSTGGEVGWQSGVLEADLSEASLLRLTLRPGHASHLELTTAFRPEIDRRQRALRTMAFQLDGSDPAQPMVLEGPLAELVGGNWDDERYPGRRLRRLELRVPDSEEAKGVVFERLEILGPEATYAGAVADRRILEVDGVLRPGWFVRGGASVTLDSPVDAGELSTYLSALGDVTARIVVGSQVLESAPGSTWTHHRLEVSGGPVRLEAEGDGIVLFGNPTVRAHGDTESPNIVVVMADTLRADHLGAWGSRAGISPHIDALADEGATFGLAQSTASWTKPAIPTLLTGIWATTHQVGAHSYTDRLPPSVPTLQGALQAQGWRTGSFAASPLGSTLSGLERDFDVAFAPRHWTGDAEPLGHPGLDVLSDEMFRWWSEGEGPVFAYLHAMETHAWRRAPYQQAPGETRTSYELSIADLDRKLATLRANLEARGELHRTLIVLTSDHGESFGDHGVHDHGTSLQQSQIHVPLIFWAQDLSSSWSSDPVSLADVAPTIVDLVGASPLTEADGLSLRPAIATGAAVHRFVPSARERFVWRYLNEPIYAVTTAAGMKLIRQQGEYQRFFDLDADLCESATTGWPVWFAQRHLDQWLAHQRQARTDFSARHPSRARGLRADDVRMLEEMGYLEPTP